MLLENKVILGPLPNLSSDDVDKVIDSGGNASAFRYTGAVAVQDSRSFPSDCNYDPLGVRSPRFNSGYSPQEKSKNHLKIICQSIIVYFN